MLYLAENLKALRKGKDLTQEEVAEALGVSPQSVSKWERGETFPDITLLPTLSNLFKVSVDALIGMDKINDLQTKNNVFAEGYKHLRSGDINAAIEVFSDALKLFPNDEDYMSYLAMTLALDGEDTKLSQSIDYCEHILANGQGVKACHTTRAALCFIYMKAGEKKKAVATALSLPHVRESREMVIAEIEKELSDDEINSYLKFIAVGEIDEQDIIEIDFGINMISLCTQYDLLGKIKALRDEIDAHENKEGFIKLPQIRVRDKNTLSQNQVRVRRYADYLLDKEFACHDDAGTQVIQMLRKIAGID